MASTEFGDIRAYNQQYKRDKDQKFKWANGFRPKGGFVNFGNGQVRPEKPAKKFPMTQHEFNKVEHYRNGKEEIKDSMPQVRNLIQEMSVPRTVQQMEDTDITIPTSHFRPLALEALVVKTGRETEQYVQNEFVILDDHGETASGKQGIRVLRKAEKAMIDTEGFELV